MNRPPSSNAYNPTSQERADLARMVDYSSVQSLAEIWPLAKERFGSVIALQDPHAKPPVQLTYAALAEQIQQFAGGLQALGLQPHNGDTPPRVALFSDNSPRWFIADQGIIAAGAADAVRSSQADRDELLYILENSGSTGLVVENLAALKKLRPRLDDLPVEWVVLLSDEQPPDEALPVRNFSQVMAQGAGKFQPPPPPNRQTLATLLYTSGTTGKPKGVSLTHGNLLHQISTLGAVIQPQPGDRALTLLPTWHTLGRTAEYFLLCAGCTQIYTNIRYIKRDFKDFKPQYLVAVPRLWESIYEGVQKQFREQPENKQRLVKTFLNLSQRYIENKRTWQQLQLQPQPSALPERLLAGIQAAALWPIHALAGRLVYSKIRQATGGELKYAICGGGSLAMHLENFFEIVGLQLLVGYGLTETSPVLSARRYWHNLRGSSGKPIPGTEIKIVDLETRKELPAGQRGLVLARGPQLMAGYYQNSEATAKAIDKDGWFDTGDLGWVTAANDLVLTGRAKDTIVLTNGENIEPQPIEDACARSPYIDQIVLVGQDQKALGALIVPNLDALQKWAATQNMQLRLPAPIASPPAMVPGQAEMPAADLDSKPVQDLFRQELNREVQNRPGYRPDDRIGPFRLILEPFSTDNGMLTQTLKIKRPVVMERYRDMIDGMFS
ncbi:AMP-binding protein [Kamptonema formosum]|uniref:AMP-binding protein n=1 Tax=Kamptonema formosum TaxID=331992 RepID=UPI00034AE1E5|nr:AMP-binding protein [Oscillatoria sp. PCC 10802]